VFVLAANDVTLDSTVVIMVGSIEVDVSGSTATLDSIAVDGSTITAVMGTYLKVVAPSGNALDFSTTAASLPLAYVMALTPHL